MECPKCGSQIKEGERFCSNCGSPINNIQNNNQINFNSQANQLNQNDSQIQYNNNQLNNVSNHKKIPTKLILILVIIIVIISIFIGIKILTNNETYKENTNTDNKADITVENENNTDNKVENTVENENNIVTYSGFNFKIPKELDATPSEDGILITNNDISIAVVIEYQSNTQYKNLTRMKNSLISIFKQNSDDSFDYTNASTIESNYNGTRFLITKDIKKGENIAEVSCAETNNGVFLVSIVKQNGNITDNERILYYTIVASANNN